MLVQHGAAQGGGPAGQSVLIVEDEFLSALALQSSVETLGYAVIGPFGRVGDALAALDTDPPDAALLDVRLGEGTSAPIAAVLRARDIPFLLLTGYERDDLEPSLRHATLLNKPVSDGLLRKALARLLS